MGVKFYLPGIQDPTGWLWKISVGLGGLGPIDICHSFISIWSKEILEALALLRALSLCGNTFS